MTTLTDGVEPTAPIDFESQVVSLNDYAELKLGLARIRNWLEELSQELSRQSDHALTALAIMDTIADEYEDLPAQHRHILYSLLWLASRELITNHDFDPEELRKLI